MMTAQAATSPSVRAAAAAAVKAENSSRSRRKPSPAAGWLLRLLATTQFMNGNRVLASVLPSHLIQIFIPERALFRLCFFAYSTPAGVMLSIIDTY